MHRFETDPEEVRTIRWSLVFPVELTRELAQHATEKNASASDDVARALAQTLGADFELEGPEREQIEALEAIHGRGVSVRVLLDPDLSREFAATVNRLGLSP